MTNQGTWHEGEANLFVTWLLIPFIIVAMATLWVFCLQTFPASPYLSLGCTFVFCALISAFSAFLVIKHFPEDDIPGLLLAGCGLVLWGICALVGPVIGLMGKGIHPYGEVVAMSRNICIWESAIFQLCGIAVLLRSGNFIRSKGWWLLPAHGLVAVALGMIMWPVLSGLLSSLLSGREGMDLRQLVLGSAIGMLAVTFACIPAWKQAEVFGVSSRQSFELLTWISGALLRSETELGRITDELIQNEEQLAFQSTLLGQISDAVIMTDNDACVTYWNQCAEILYGLSREQALGLHIDQCRHTFWINTADEIALNAALEDGHTWCGETMNLTLDGRQVFVESTISSLRDTRGDVLGTLAVIRDISARKDWEKTVHSLARFPAESVSPVMRTDKDGELLYANEASHDVLSCWNSGIGGKVPPAIAKVVADAYQTGRQKVMELSSGGQDYSFVFVPIQSEVYVNIYGSNITELKLLQQRESETMAVVTAAKAAADTIRAMNIGVALVHEDGTVISVNPAFEMMTGYDGGNIACKPVDSVIEEIVAGECRDSVRALLVLARAGCHGRSIFADFVGIHGSVIPVVVDVSQIAGTEGRTMTLVMTIKDITELRKSEESLRRAVAHNRSLIEASLDPLVAIDAEGRITDVNAATEKITGYSRTELVGTDFTAYFTSPGQARIGFQKAFSNGQAQNFALEIRHRNGLTTPVLYNASVYRDPAGSIIGVFAAARDITARKLAEQAVESYQNELRSLSSRLLLSEEQARRQIAVTLHDTVGQTLALSKLKLGALANLLHEEEARNSLNEIRRIFDSAVQQTRTLSFELSPPILYELGLDAALEWLGEQYEKPYGFRTHFVAEGDKSRFDESLNILVFQSVRELLANAGKHAAAKNVRISCVTSDDNVVITVADDGKGFNAEKISEVLRKKNSLGLFSIRERMKHMGGQLSIESAPGRGTSATLIVPVMLKGARYGYVGMDNSAN